MYSAHASILENLIKNNGKIKKLIIDAGGLKAPNGSFINKNIFDNYFPSTKKTFHAKVIYLDTPNILSLWTGNLRKQTLSSQDNIIITNKISKTNGAKVKKWFNCFDKCNNLIINFSGQKVKTVKLTNNRIWDSFLENIENIKILRNEEIMVYAFSPWGCSKFVKEINKIFKGKKLIKIYLHTRQVMEQDPLWIDTGRNNPIIVRYVKRIDPPLPHYKCVFITSKKNNEKPKLIYAYIGSANLTQSAFFKHKNIEYAAFFDNIRKNSSLDKIFNKIKSKRNWKVRIPIKTKDYSTDESKQESSEEDNQNNFEIRKQSKKLCKSLQSTKLQKALENSYLNNEPLQYNDFTIKVFDCDNGIFNINVVYKKLDFDLSIKRNHVEKDIYSEKDVRVLFDKLLDKTSQSKESSKQNSKVIHKNNKPHNKSFRNIRFPMEQMINNKELLKEKKNIISKLTNGYSKFNESDKIAFELWSNIISKLD